MKYLSHSVKIADITITSRSTGQGVAYTLPQDLVLFLLWFLGSTTAQILALIGVAVVYQLHLSWLKLLGFYSTWMTGWHKDLALMRLALTGLVADLLTIQVARSFG